MAVQDVILIISALTVAMTTVIGSIFAGWAVLKQIPEVHRLVNRNFTEQKTEIASLQGDIRTLNVSALARSEALADRAASAPPLIVPVMVPPSPPSPPSPLADPATGEVPVATRAERQEDADAVDTKE